jgi:hypothetical protein
MSLNTSLVEDPSPPLRRKIVCHFWRKQEAIVNIESYASYFHYYNRTCQSLSLGVSYTELDSLSIKAHEDLLDMVDEIWKLSDEIPNFDRPQARAALVKLPLHVDQPLVNVNNSINVLFRLWFTVRIQDDDFSPIAKTIQWDDNSRIRDFLVRNFPEPRSRTTGAIERNFTAVNLDRMCGVNVEWTCQLEDHLRYDVESRTVSVYSLSKCLQDHLEWLV